MLAGNICTKLFGCFVTGKNYFPFSASGVTRGTHVFTFLGFRTFYASISTVGTSDALLEFLIFTFVTSGL